MRTSSTDSLLLFDVVMEDSAWCPTHQRNETMRQCPFVQFLTLRKVFFFFLIHLCALFRLDDIFRQNFLF